MLVSVRWAVFDRVWRRSQGTDMHDHSARSSSKRLAEQLQRLWSTPAKAECQRLSRAAGANEQQSNWIPGKMKAAQLRRATQLEASR